MVREEVLTRKEVAKAFKVSESTIENWKIDGMPIIKRRGTTRFLYSECLNWLKGGE